MDGSPSSVISLGYGSWGSAGLVLTLGFGVGAAIDNTGQLCGTLTVRSLVQGTLQINELVQGQIEIGCC